MGMGACERVDIYAVTEASELPSDTESTDAVGASTDPVQGTDTQLTDEVQSTDEVQATDGVQGTDGVQSTDTPGTTDAEMPTTTDDPALSDATQDAGTSEPTQLSCPTPVLAPGNTNVDVQVGGMSRSYVLHVPPSYDGSAPVPLIVDFHGMGAGESGQNQLANSPYPAVTDPEGVIMAFPDGLAGPLGPAWNMGPCCVANVDDLAFARALVADVQSAACIDPDRVYAVGVLTGGGMVNHLACEAADIFAAIAPAAFDLLQETVESCSPTRPITVMSFRATEDTRVPYDGGGSSLVPGMPITFLGAKETLERWAQINDCSDMPSAEDANGCTFHSNCSEGVEVILCTDYGGMEGPGDANLAWPVLSRHVR